MISVSLVAAVVLVELNQDEMMLSRLKGVSVPHEVAEGRLQEKSHYFFNYKHNEKRQTIEILMLASDWEALPRYTIGFVMLRGNTLFSKACYVKEVAGRHKLNPNIELQKTIVQDGSSKVKVTRPNLK